MEAVQSQPEENGHFPTLTVTFGATNRKTRTLTKTTTLLGRSRNADVKLDAPEVAPVHCIVTRAGDKLTIRDCDSRTGTIVNGQPIREAELNDNDTVQVGPFSFAIKLPVKGDDSSSGVQAVAGSDPELAARFAALEQAERELAERRAEFERAREDYEGLRSAGGTAAASVIELDIEALRAETRQAMYETDVAPLKSELERLNSQLADIRRENERLRKSTEDALAESAMTAAVGAEAEAQVRQIEALRAELAEARDQRNRLSEEMQNVQQESERRLQSLREDLEKERGRIKDLMKQAAAQFTKPAPAPVAGAADPALQKQIDMLTAQLRAKQVELDAAMETIAKAQPAMPAEIADYENQLNQFRVELENAQMRLQEQENALHESIKQNELQLSRERAEIAREKSTIERTRNELRAELELAEREAKNFEKMASINRLTNEIRGQGRQRQADEQQTPDEGSLSGRIRGFLKRVGDK